jgi:hypothetical protein
LLRDHAVSAIAHKPSARAHTLLHGSHNTGATAPITRCEAEIRAQNRPLGHVILGCHDMVRVVRLPRAGLSALRK